HQVEQLLDKGYRKKMPGNIQMDASVREAGRIGNLQAWKIIFVQLNLLQLDQREHGVDSPFFLCCGNHYFARRNVQFVTLVSKQGSIRLVNGKMNSAKGGCRFLS